MLESTVLACMEVVVEGAVWLRLWMPLMLRGEEGTGSGGCPCGGWWLALSQQSWQLPQAAACSAIVSLSSHVLQIGTLGLPVDQLEPGRSEDEVGAAVQSGSRVGADALDAL